RPWTGWTFRLEPVWILLETPSLQTARARLSCMQGNARGSLRRSFSPALLPNNGGIGPDAWHWPTYWCYLHDGKSFSRRRLIPSLCSIHLLAEDARSAGHIGGVFLLA